MSDLLGGTKKKASKWPWRKEFWDFPGTVSFIAFGIAVVLLCVIWCSCLNLDDATKLTLTVGISGGLLLVLNFASNYRRTVAFEDQLKQQRLSINQQHEGDKRRDQQQLYTTNVQHLGHISESVKLGGIYGLERLARESKDSDKPWGPKVAEILCAHVRTTTAMDDYSIENEEKPSNEIAAILKVLTQGDSNPFYSMKFDLSGANLVRADLSRASLTRADLSGANLSRANLVRADLSRASLRGVDLSRASLSGANLSGVRLSRANLSGAILARANLARAMLSRANLTRTYLRRANFNRAYLIGTDLSRANLTGANLTGANLMGANLTGANLSGSIRLSEDRIKWSNFSDCKDYAGANFENIYWGLYTQDLDMGSYENQDRYLAENAERRQPTPEEKEYLVGKDNLDKCVWGDIYVLEDKD